MLRTRATALPLLLMLALVAGLFAACASSNLPAGYESLKAEVNIAEASGYIKGLRTSYLQARQSGKMTAEQFVLAVKTDETLTTAWNQFLEIQKVKGDATAIWAQVIQALTKLEGIVSQWVTPTVKDLKPAFLGAKL